MERTLTVMKKACRELHGEARRRGLRQARQGWEDRPLKVQPQQEAQGPCEYGAHADRHEEGDLDEVSRQARDEEDERPHSPQGLRWRQPLFQGRWWIRRAWGLLV